MGRKSATTSSFRQRNSRTNYVLVVLKRNPGKGPCNPEVVGAGPRNDCCLALKINVGMKENLRTVTAKEKYQENKKKGIGLRSMRETKHEKKKTKTAVPSVRKERKRMGIQKTLNQVSAT